MRDMAAPESISTLYHFPACTVIVGQLMMSGTVIWSCVGSPPCPCESLLGEDSVSLNDQIPPLNHWSDHLSYNSPCVDPQFSPLCFS